MVIVPSPRLRKQCGMPAGTQVAWPATRSNSSSPTTAVASPSWTSTLSSTLCECSGMPVPGEKTVMPVVTLLPSQFHFPTKGMDDAVAAVEPLDLLGAQHHRRGDGLVAHADSSEVWVRSNSPEVVTWPTTTSAAISRHCAKCRDALCAANASASV